MPRVPLTFLLLGLGAIPTRAEPQAPKAIATVTLNPSRATGGATVTGLVTLSSDADEGGFLVWFQSSNTSLATVPDDKVLIQSGARTASFVVQTKPVAGNPNVVSDPPFVDMIAWRWVGGGGPANPPRPIGPTATGRLIVLPAALAMLTLSPSRVSGGTAVTGAVQLTGPAPAGGVTVRLTSTVTGADPAPRAILPGSARGPVSVPAQVTVPAGATSITFQVTTRKVTAATPAQVTAAYGTFNSQSATVTITP